MATGTGKKLWPKGTSGNPKGRKPGALTLAKLIAPDVPKLVKMLRDNALKKNDVRSAQALLDRCVPALRPESQRVGIPDLAGAKTPTAKAEAIIAAAGRGEISPTVATELLTAMAGVMKVVEVDELARRVGVLEGKI